MNRKPLFLVRPLFAQGMHSHGAFFRGSFGILLACALAGSCTSSADVIKNVAGTGSKGFSGDGGLAVEARLSFPCGVIRGNDEAVYICDTGNHRIRKALPNGRITTIVGIGEAGWDGDGGPATAARLNEPYEVRIDRKGNLFWVERLSHTVRKRDSQTGIISTIAGTGMAGFSGDNGPANKAQLNEPHSIVLDESGLLYICDVKNHRLRKVDPRSGLISTFAGNGEKKPTPDGAKFAEAPLFGPRALDIDSSGNLILALREGNQILKLDLKKGTVHLVAGTGKKGFTGDGSSAQAATLAGPKGVSVAPNGNIYFADTENHVIRVVEAGTGIIRTIAGTGSAGDGSAANPRQCQLNRPHGVFVDRDGSLLIGDSDAHRIRIVFQQN